MSIFRKIELALGALLLAIVVILSVQVWYLRAKADIVKEKVVLQSADLGAADAYIKQTQIVVKEREIKDAAVTKAIENNHDWAAVELPDDVADQLRDPQRSAVDLSAKL